ncbi:MAG TPA: hypothetical protein VMB21_11225, partial [Candidatus Limnocylindria bacterium]|nr:hypothetical protein [Candidatus Limnocylindria bacterium]
MHQSNLTAEAAGLLDVAANAATKGLAQWLTPDALARDCAALLPRHRPTVCDLTCGAGSLLQAAAHGTKAELLGFDLDTSALAQFGPHPTVTVAELTEAGDLLADAGWQGDLFVLNPPWDLHLRRERLDFLTLSEREAVRVAFHAHDGRTPRDCIDSTVATLCIALDRCSRVGEGFLLGYADTVDRLILGYNAPHFALAQHIWAYARLPGARMGISGDVICLWFARGHNTGPRDVTVPFLAATQGELSGDEAQTANSELATRLASLHLLRQSRFGPELHRHDDQWQFELPKWRAVVEELKQRRKAESARPFHLWLRPDGTIGTALSRYEERSRRVDRGKVERLHRLEGQRPLQLAVQREQRDLLRGVTG